MSRWYWDQSSDLHPTAGALPPAFFNRTVAIVTAVAAGLIAAAMASEHRVVPPAAGFVAIAALSALKLLMAHVADGAIRSRDTALDRYEKILTRSMEIRSAMLLTIAEELDAVREQEADLARSIDGIAATLRDAAADLRGGGPLESPGADEVESQRDDDYPPA